MSKKKIMAILFAFVLVMATTISAFAAVTEYVVTDSAGQVYVYDFEDLQQSYENYLLGVGSTVLFDHYLDKVETGQVTAVYDDVSKQYVDFAAMDEAYTALVLEGKEDTFDMDEYTAGDSAVAKEMPATVIGVELDETGEVKEEEKSVVPVVDEFRVIEISAIDANTIKVTFAGEGAPAEAVEVVDFTPTPLVDGENTVTFTCNEKEFTEKVTYEAPAALAVEGVSAINSTDLQNVQTNESFKVTFNKGILASEVTATNFIMKRGEVVTPVNLVLSDDKKVVTMTPATTLQANTNYTLTVAAGIKGLVEGEALAEAKTLSFKTGDFITATTLRANNVVVDTVNVTGIFSTNVTNGRDITLQYPASLNPATVNDVNVKLANKDGVEVPRVVSYNDSNKTIVITLGDSLNQLSAVNPYTLSVKDVKTLDGKSVEDYSYTFTVSTDYAPIVTLSDGTAVNANTGVYGSLITEKYAGDNRIGFKLNIAFRAAAAGAIQAMQADTLKAENVWLEEAATDAKVEATLSYNEGSRVLSLTPKANLKENTQYRIIVKPDVRNNLGLQAEAVNQLATSGGSGNNFGKKSGSQQYVQTFTTGHFIRPQITTTSITQGAIGVPGTTKSIQIKMDKDLNLTTPAVASMISTEAIKLVDNSFNEVIDLGTGASDGKNTATVTVANDMLSIAFTGGGDTGNFRGLQDKDGKIKGSSTYDATDSDKNRIGHTFTLFVAGESKGANALRSNLAGAPMKEDFELTFTLEAADTKAPTIAKVEAMAHEDGVGSTQYKRELSKTAAVTNVQGNGTLVANEALRVTFSKKMLADSGANAANLATNYTLEKFTGGAWVDATPNFTVTPASDNTIFVLTTDVNTKIATDSRYRLTIKSNIVDATPAANKLGTDQVYVFTTGGGPALDGTNALPLPFAVAATGLPTTGGAASLENTRNSLLIQFTTPDSDNKINPSTLTTDYIVVKEKASGDLVPGKLYSDQATTLPVVGTTDKVYFKPDNAWKAATTYTVTLKQGIKANAIGNVTMKDYTYEFTVAGAQAVPSVVSTNVVEGQGGVPVDQVIEVQFDMAMDKTTINDTNITLSAVAGAAAAITVKYDAETKKATVTPKNYLEASTTYTLTVTNAVKAANANPISADYVVNFGTSTTAKTPGIVSAKYTPGPTGTSDGYLTIVFEKAVDTSALTADTGSFTVNPNALPAATATVKYGLSADTKTLVITGLSAGDVIPGVTSIQVNGAAAAGTKIEAYTNGVSNNFKADAASAVTVQ